MKDKFRIVTIPKNATPSLMGDINNWTVVSGKNDFNTKEEATDALNYWVRTDSGKHLYKLIKS